MEPIQKISDRIRRLADPRPALAVGIGLWGVASVVVFFGSDDLRENVLPVCVAGIVVGLLGSALFLVQRRAARRGSRGAQTGLL